MKTIYITSTLHHDWNLAFNPKICSALEKTNVECYLPQRDTNQAGQDNEKFEQNFQAIKNCKILLAIAKNESVNWGVEVGFAIALDKKLIIIAEQNHTVPLMAAQAIEKIFYVDDLEKIDDYIAALSQNCKV